MNGNKLSKTAKEIISEMYDQELDACRNSEYTGELIFNADAVINGGLLNEFEISDQDKCNWQMYFSNHSHEVEDYCKELCNMDRGEQYNDEYFDFMEDCLK